MIQVNDAETAFITFTTQYNPAIMRGDAVTVLGYEK